MRTREAAASVLPWLFVVLFVVLLAGCGDKVTPFVPMTMPSGRVVKVQSYLPEHLFNGEQALVLKFVPDAALDDAAALDAEIARLWQEVKLDAQKREGAHLVLIRAVPASAAGWDERQSQYVFRRQADGTWSEEKDPDVRLR